MLCMIIWGHALGARIESGVLHSSKGFLLLSSPWWEGTGPMQAHRRWFQHRFPTPLSTTVNSYQPLAISCGWNMYATAIAMWHNNSNCCCCSFFLLPPSPFSFFFLFLRVSFSVYQCIQQPILDDLVSLGERGVCKTPPRWRHLFTPCQDLGFTAERHQDGESPVSHHHFTTNSLCPDIPAWAHYEKACRTMTFTLLHVWAGILQPRKALIFIHFMSSLI